MTLSLPTIARKRRSYEQRAAINSRAARALAKAVSQPKPFVETEDGFRVVQWTSEDMSAYSHADIAAALRGSHVVEHDQLLEQLPPSAIKYACTKGWLFKEPSPATFYRVTLQASFDLRLPEVVRGRRIRFFNAKAV